MQRIERHWKVLLTALFVSLIVVSCTGGGTSGKTWFNLPAIALKVQPNGTANAYGIPVNVVLLQPAMLQQLQSANVQRIEARWGYNGVHVFLNGEDLPYLAWDEASANELGAVVNAAGIPQANLVNTLLPWLRKIGWGVRLDLPLASGARALSVPRWSGETSVSPVAVTEPTIGPLNLNNISFDDQGNGKIGRVPLSALGVTATLPPNVLAIVQTLGIDALTIQTEPDGLHFFLDDRALPFLAYDEAYLQRAMAWGEKLAPGNPTLAALAPIVPNLPGADVAITVSFTGEPAGELSLTDLNVGINPDGSVRALGIDLPGGPLVPAETLSMLQSANVQQLDVNLREGGLTLGVNGQALPAIGWTDAGLGVISSLATSLGGMPQEQIGGLLDLVNSTDVGISLDVPAAEGVEAIDVEPVVTPTFAPVDLGAFAAPVIRVALGVNDQGTITSIGNIPGELLAAVGVPPVTLPSNITGILSGLGADQIGIHTDNGLAEVQLDGETALSLQYDAASLQTLLNLVKPLLGVELLNDPNISRIIDEQILPLAPGAQLDVTVDLQ